MVGVISNSDDKSSCCSDSGVSGRVCLARRQFPLVIEPELTMVMGKGLATEQTQALVLLAGRAF